MNEIRENDRAGIGGWLLLLIVLLVAWGPLEFGLVAANALAALNVRGVSLAIVLIVRLAVTAFGLAAGLALARRRPGAVTIARVAIVTAAATDLFVYTTSYVPNNRAPGDTPFYIAASLTYWTLWFVYLARSRRVRDTFS